MLKLSLKFKLILFLILASVSAAFHFGVDQHQSTGEELFIQNEQGDKSASFTHWSLSNGKDTTKNKEIPLSSLKQLESNNLSFVANKHFEDQLSLSQQVKIPGQSLIKVSIEVASLVLDNEEKEPAEVDFLVELGEISPQWQGFWETRHFFSLNSTTPLTKYTHFYWASDQVSGIKLNFVLPKNSAYISLGSVSVQAVQDRRFLGLSFYRIDLLLIFTTCLVLVWIVISNFKHFNWAINSLVLAGVLLGIYVLKSFIGLDLFDGFSIGIWDPIIRFFNL